MKEHNVKCFNRYLHNKPPLKCDIVFNIEFTDNKKNKIVNITFKNQGNLKGRINRRIMTSKNNFKFNKINKLTIIIEERIANHVINIFCINENTDGS